MEKTILVADDEKMVRFYSEHRLKNTFPDYNIECFEDGKSLDERLSQSLKGVHAVITDNQMPGMEGSEIIKKYATNLEDITFILYYGGDDKIGKEAVRDGACGYISKFSTYQKVLDILNEKLEGKIN